MAVDALLDKMVRKIPSAEAILDQSPDLKEVKRPWRMCGNCVMKG